MSVYFFSVRTCYHVCLHLSVRTRHHVCLLLSVRTCFHVCHWYRIQTLEIYDTSLLFETDMGTYLFVVKRRV